MNNISDKTLVLLPHRLISLWDMIPLVMRDLAAAQRLQSAWLRSKKRQKDDPAGMPTENERENFLSILAAVRALWIKIGLFSESNLISDLEQLLKCPNRNYSEIAESLRMILLKTQDELSVRSFVYVPFGKDQYLERNDLFGDEVGQACSDEINAHIKDAGNCLAADLNTAAVFHLMLVAEFGMRALAIKLKVKSKNIPTKEAGWSKLIEGIKKKIEIRAAKNEKKQSKKEKEFLKYCRLANEQIFFFKEIWRDNTMHAMVRFNESEALGVFERVKKLMQILATRIPLK